MPVRAQGIFADHLDPHAGDGAAAIIAVTGLPIILDVRGQLAPELAPLRPGDQATGGSKGRWGGGAGRGSPGGAYGGSTGRSGLGRGGTGIGCGTGGGCGAGSGCGTG